MANLLKQPAFYKFLGQMAQATGAPRSVGAQAGAFGEQAAEDWAARDEQKRAEKEAKKGKLGKMFGSLGGVAGGLLGTLIPGAGTVLGPVFGSTFGKAAGTLAGGGDLSWEDLGMTAASNLLSSFAGSMLGGKPDISQSAAATPQPGASANPQFFAPKGQVSGIGQATTAGAAQSAVKETPLVSPKVSAEPPAPPAQPISAEPSLAAKPVEAAQTRAAIQPKNVQQAVAAEVPLTMPKMAPAPQPAKQGFLSRMLGPESAQRMSNYVDLRYGGWPGLAAELASIPQRSEEPVSKYLRPAPGLSQEGFESLLRANLAREGAERAERESLWERELAQQQMALRRAQLAQMGTEPRPVEWVDEQGVRHRQYVPERSLLELGPMAIDRPEPERPQVFVDQQSGVAAFIDPRTRQIETAPIPGFREEPKPRYETRVVPGKGLFQIAYPPGGEPVVSPVPGTEPPQRPQDQQRRAPVVREFQTPEGVRQMQWNDSVGQWEPVPGTVPVKPQEKQIGEDSLTRLLSSIGTDLLKPWVNMDAITNQIIGYRGEYAQEANTTVQLLLAEMKQFYRMTGEIPSVVELPAEEKGKGWTKIILVFSDGSTSVPKHAQYLPPKPAEAF